MNSSNFLTIFSLFVAIQIPLQVNGFLRRCFVCRSRGELGTCKDEFTFNVTQIENVRGVKADPCASGWCAKIIQGRSINSEHDVATERTCLQRGPDDGEERCAYTTMDYKKVFICFCKGDLCNSASHTVPTILSLITLITIIKCFL
ncbi:uncharacterized protein LOC122508385 [Leptopilina heterotoma]|uniref:uncharacterized protein LOC122508385 n=1 Tax=Leptopilina heterotoma TaxID=63436 RepID=UPI001CA8B2D2|nr:uncharacterized protein LOC122508385 [Leptopilina heterotoma]